MIVAKATPITPIICTRQILRTMLIIAPNNTDKPIILVFFIVQNNVTKYPDKEPNITETNRNGE